MNKKLLILAVAGFALASCSNDEVVESAATSDANAITFRPLMSNVTRAADCALGTTGSFKATAYQTGGTSTAYFTNVVFSGTAGTYTSETKYYWPNTYNLDFYAWSPADYVASTDNYTGFTITPGTTISAQPDFVYAVTRGWGTYSTPTHNGKTGVVINFSHAESKVIIQLKNTNDDLIITVGNITIGNLRGTETFTWNGVTDGSTPVVAATATTDDKYTSGVGTLSYLNGTWTATSNQTSYYTVTMGTDDVDGETEGVQGRNVFNGNVVAARELTSTASNHEMILIPQVLNPQTTYVTESGANQGKFLGAYISVQVKIQNKANSAYVVGSADTYVEAMWPLTALTWLPGHKYTYTVDLGGGGYYTTDQDTDEGALDPILEGAEIKFVTVTVDDWKEAAGGVYVVGL